MARPARGLLLHLGNAIKFTHEGFIRVEARIAEENARGAVLEFAVLDSGIGVPTAKQAQLFNPFSQADGSTTRKYGGTGLGLSIVRSLAHLMDGDAGMDSEPGKGSRFWFRIRAGVCRPNTPEQVRDVPVEEQAVAPQVPKHRRVLLVDDNPVNRKVAELLLKRFGLHVVNAQDGQVALDLLTEGEPVDLVLMDIQMPVMDGLTATGRIRIWERDTGRSRLPIIALTAGAFAEDKGQCLAAGMDDFLAKPIDPEALQQALAQWLDRADGASMDAVQQPG